MFLPSRCCVCFSLGAGSQLMMIGMRMRVMKYVAITLIAATTPNSTSMDELVKYNTPKPMAVVMFARNKSTPMVSIITERAFTLFLCLAYSLWYLLNRNTQFGIPMTMISGAMSPLSIVIL